MYSNYTLYKTYGGKMSESDYNIYANEACDYIDVVTRGRAPHTDTMSDKIKKCECKLADALLAASEIPVCVTSEGNDGVSISYSQSANQDLQIICFNICKKHLSYPINLLYAGVDYSAN